MSKIKKSKNLPASGRIHKHYSIPENNLKFSFKYFNLNEKFHTHEVNSTYLNAFLNRLKSVSSLTVKEFKTNNDNSLRAHTHDWEKTTEKEGFTCLNEQLQQCEPWQFALSANEHGRIHGILLDEVFYIVWLDPKHKLYF